MSISRISATSSADSFFLQTNAIQYGAFSASLSLNPGVYTVSTTGGDVGLAFMSASNTIISQFITTGSTPIAISLTSATTRIFATNRTSAAVQVKITQTGIDLSKNTDTVEVYTSSGTYPHTGLGYVLIVGGGAGGNGNGSPSGNVGGGSGGIRLVGPITLTGNESMVIGAGGTGGTGRTPSNGWGLIGNNGGATSFGSYTSNGGSQTGNGGSPGGANNGGSTSQLSQPVITGSTGGGGAGGIKTGNVGVGGNPGGGDGVIGVGGAGGGAPSGSGATGNGYGSGGGGGGQDLASGFSSYNNQTANGGNGRPGVIYVRRI